MDDTTDPDDDAAQSEEDVRRDVRGSEEEGEEDEDIGHGRTIRPHTAAVQAEQEDEEGEESDEASTHEDDYDDEFGEGDDGLQTSAPKLSGRRPLGHMFFHERPATQGGPNGYFPSAVPENARVKSARRRERAVLRHAGVKVFRVKDTTYSHDLQTGKDSLQLSRLSRTAHGVEGGFWQQRKLISVPFIRKKRPATTVGHEGEAVKTELPDHLKQRFRYLVNRNEVRDFEKLYNTSYKEKDVMAWGFEDVFSFVADSFINDVQVDVAGLALPKRLVHEDGVRADNCLDVLVMRQVKTQRLDGKRLMDKVKRGLVAKTLKLDGIDASLADSLVTAIQDYQRLNARKKLPQHEGVTAKQTFEAAHADNADVALIQDLMVREVNLRRERSRLNDLRAQFAPVRIKFEQGIDESQQLEQHYDRLKTPEVRHLVRPKSRRDVLLLKKTVSEDLARYQEKWQALRDEEQALASAVRAEEMKTLALRQKVETAQFLRDSRRRLLLEEQARRAAELEEERAGTVQQTDKQLKEVDDMLWQAYNTVQTQFDRSLRNELLRMIGDIFSAKRALVQACRYEYRQKRVEALESALEFAVDKLREGDSHLEKLQDDLLSAATIEDSAPNAVVGLTHLLAQAREHLRRGIRDYRRTGAMTLVKENIADFERSLTALDERIKRIIAAKKQAEQDAAAAAAAAAAAEAAAVAAEEEVYESSDEEQEKTDFEKTLDRLIEEKQRQALERIPDSLCSMQQWLFEVKSKSKGNKTLSSAGDSKVADSQSSTRPASPQPWASLNTLPPVTGPSPTHAAHAKISSSPLRGKTSATMPSPTTPMRARTAANASPPRMRKGSY